MSVSSNPTDIDRLGPAMQAHATYIGNLNNLLGFYLVIAGFLFAGIFQLITADNSIPILASVVALLGVTVTVLFHMMDTRSRVIIDHVEGVIGALEARDYGATGRPMGDIPKPRSFRSATVVGDPNAKKWLDRPRGFYSLVRLIYWLIGGAFGCLALVCLAITLWAALQPPSKPPPPSTHTSSSVQIEVTQSATHLCCKKKP